ncbi:MAG: hypothetical protein Q9183_004418, partial [Haloplaca sp. 2 TL-2023]
NKQVAQGRQAVQHRQWVQLSPDERAELIRAQNSRKGERMPISSEKRPIETSQHANTDTQPIGLSDNQLASNSATGTSASQQGEYLTIPDFEAVIMHHYKGPTWMGSYDFKTLVDKDREVYKYDLPPYISPRAAPTMSLAPAPKHTFTVRGNKIELIPHRWMGTTTYYDVVHIDGRAFIVRRYFTTALKFHYQVWLGYRSGFAPDAFLFHVHKDFAGMMVRRVQRLSAHMVTASYDARSEDRGKPLPRLGVPSDPYDTVIKPPSPQESTATVPNLFPLNRISKAKPEDFDDWVKRLHVHYGESTPQFVQERGDCREGDTMAIVKASPNGEYPGVETNTPQSEAKRGTRQGFAGAVFAFKKEPADSLPAAILPRQSPGSDTHHKARSPSAQGTLYFSPFQSPQLGSDAESTASAPDSTIESSVEITYSEVEELRGTNVDEPIMPTTGNESPGSQSHAEASEYDGTTAANYPERELATTPPELPMDRLTDGQAQRQHTTAGPHRGDVLPAVDVEGYDLAEILRQDKVFYGHEKPPFVVENNGRTPERVAVILLDHDGVSTGARQEMSVSEWSHRRIYRTLRLDGHECIVVMGYEGPHQGPRIVGYTFHVWFGNGQGLSQKPVARRIPFKMGQDDVARLISRPPFSSQRRATSDDTPNRNEDNGTDTNQHNLRGKQMAPKRKMKRAPNTDSHASDRTKRSYREIPEVLSDAPRASKTPRRTQVVYLHLLKHDP